MYMNSSMLEFQNRLEKMREHTDSGKQLVWIYLQVQVFLAQKLFYFSFKEYIYKQEQLWNKMYKYLIYVKISGT